ncbi:MAG: ABC transporter permease subunit [Clostridia bacterium]|nr:ABC transporter permease subunit [Clostridia bacterium]
MNNKTKKILENILYPILVILIILAIWLIFAKIANSEFIMPTPADTFISLGNLLVSSEFWIAFGSTLLRTLIAFVIAFLLASTFALLSFLYKPVAKIFAPLISILRATPTIAVILLFVIWTNANIAPMLISILVIFPILYTSIYSALNNLDKDVLQMCKVYKVSNKNIIFKVCVPQVWANCYLSVSSAIALNLKLMVAGEVLANTTQSLGGLMQGAKIYFEMADLLALTTVTIILALILENLINLLNRPIRRWQ